MRSWLPLVIAVSLDAASSVTQPIVGSARAWHSPVRQLFPHELPAAAAAVAHQSSTQRRTIHAGSNVASPGSRMTCRTAELRVTSPGFSV